MLLSLQPVLLVRCRRSCNVDRRKPQSKRKTIFRMVRHPDPLATSGDAPEGWWNDAECIFRTEQTVDRLSVGGVGPWRGCEHGGALRSHAAVGLRPLAASANPLSSRAAARWHRRSRSREERHPHESKPRRCSSVLTHPMIPMRANILICSPAAMKPKLKAL